MPPTIVRYTLLEGRTARLTILPWIHVRLHEEPVDPRPRERMRVERREEARAEIGGPSPFPPIGLLAHGQVSVGEVDLFRHEV